MARTFTCKILDLVDEGMLDPKWLCAELLTYMSESEVQDFYETVLSDIEENGDE